jgi:nitroreductase
MDQSELLAAITARHAVRRYLDRPIPAQVRAELDEECARCNAESGLAMRIFYDEPEGFSGRLAYYGRFRGVQNYIAVITTGTGQDVAGGYYGQRLVLLAQHLGLNTCWVGLTYNKRKARTNLEADETLALTISLGYGETQGHPHKSKPIEALGHVRDGSEMPAWFQVGLEAAALAPTAMHQQKFHFELDGTTVHATKGIGSYTATDLGIAKLHFEIGAGQANWSWA